MPYYYPTPIEAVARVWNNPGPKEKILVDEGDTLFPEQVFVHDIAGKYFSRHTAGNIFNTLSVPTSDSRSSGGATLTQ